MINEVNKLTSDSCGELQCSCAGQIYSIKLINLLLDRHLPFFMLFGFGPQEIQIIKICYAMSSAPGLARVDLHACHCLGP